VITQLPKALKFVEDDGKMTDRAADVMRDLVQLSIITGNGSPEGVIEAAPTRLYMDTAGAAGSILYIKRDADISGDRTQGWILV